MSFDRTALARQALQAALKVRQKLDIDLADPVCIYDLAPKLGLKILFEAIPSMEGLYCANLARILINADRPAGRQAFSCAHEIGHHVFGHGDRIDLLSISDNDAPKDPAEFLADCFAGFFLMPKLAVSNAFHRRQWTPATATSIQLFTIAGMLGVGYETLIGHMQFSLRMLSKASSDRLRVSSPKEIRKEILGRAHVGGLVVADTAWAGRPIDVAVGDLILAPSKIQIKGDYIRLINNGSRSETLLEAVAPGSAQIQQESSGWATFVRVSRKAFHGHAIFRHLPESADE